MTIWIDQPIWPRHGTVFAHLISDTSLEELHAFAVRVGLHPRSFEGDHYDVPQERYAAVLAAGATSTTGSDVVRRLIASGLRLRKRRGDRPVARIPAMVFPDGTRASVDLDGVGPSGDRPGCVRGHVLRSGRRRPVRGRPLAASRRLGIAGRVARGSGVGPRGRGARDPGGDRARGRGGRPRGMRVRAVHGRRRGPRSVASGSQLPPGVPDPGASEPPRRWREPRTTSMDGAGWTAPSSSGSAVPTSGGRWFRGCSGSCRRRGLASSS